MHAGRGPRNTSVGSPTVPHNASILKDEMRKACWLLILAISGCTAMLGGPKSVEYDTVAIQFDNATTPAQAAAQLQELGADLALISTPRDAGWVLELGTLMKLVPTRPGRVNDMTLAFLATKPEGDTTLTIKAASGGNIRMHDALYK